MLRLLAPTTEFRARYPSGTALLEQMLAHRVVDGVQATVVQEGVAINAIGGMAGKKQMQFHTKMPLRCCTKVVAAAHFMHAFTSRGISIAEPLVNLYPTAKAWAADTTLLDLLNHQVVFEADPPARAAMSRVGTPWDDVHAKLRPTTKPAGKFTYSTFFGYNILGRALAKAIPVSLDVHFVEFVASLGRAIAPSRTDIGDTCAQMFERVPSYQRFESYRQRSELRDGYWPSDSAFATSEELAKVLHAMVSVDVEGGLSIPESLTPWREVFHDDGPSPSGYWRLGLGVHPRLHARIASPGSMGMPIHDSQVLLHEPTTRSTICVLFNTFLSSDAQVIVNGRLLRAFLSDMSKRSFP